MASSYLIIFFLLVGIYKLEASHTIVKSSFVSNGNPPVHQPYRTSYHFQPLKNWMNDPNGPMLYKGIYHLFYQYNPYGTVWGPPVWAHSTSTDLINWTPQPIAIGPQMFANNNGSWSGSATILPGNKPVILFTGNNPLNQQNQVLALPENLSDPYLKKWVLLPNNPVMSATPQNHINASAFRDPTTAWIQPDGHWRVLVGTRRNQRGLVLLYRSRDFVHWVKAKHAFYTYPKTGMWECPDFYPVYNRTTRVGAETSVIGSSVLHVLKMSLDDQKHDVYTIGRYDVTKDKYTSFDGFLNDSCLRYDYGVYYASKSFYDEDKQRRVLLGWVNELSTPKDNHVKGWAGIHTIPRKVWLGYKQLKQWPVEEVETLREKPVTLPAQMINTGSLIEVLGVTAAQADVEISFQIGDLKDVEEFETNWADPQKLCSKKGASVIGGLGPFGLLTLASKDLEEYTAVFFRIFKSTSTNKLVVLMCSDQSRSSLNPTTDKTTYGTFVKVNPMYHGLSLRILIDHSVVESFGARGKSVITARIYPTLAIDNKAHLYAFNNGRTSVNITRLNAWSMRKANIA